MNTITLKIENESKMSHFLAFIKELDFVEVVSETESTTKKKIKAKSAEENFFALAGMWENRDISADELRSETWPKRN